ncbi:glycine cleavage system H protein 2, mitochondrial-like isoform X2 [Mangifera indica]|uniref:glycine cleavage system H protein 2, mitochondrial-like isoform X2 n=1 Tax=Mangifera indica TaxID=29780 RepID=UPI001CFA3B60|nr:glycine cleavage system H protein 2, mitochondrial-like isoform X2 [Mangifera indica]
MASSRLLWASRAASYLRISVFHRGFSSIIKDLRYADSHEWVKVDEVGTSVSQGGSFGAVESVKATSDVNSPVSGKVVEVNEELSNSPALVNSSPYDIGWIIKVEMNDASELKSLMDADQYSKFCEEENSKH